MGRLTQEKLQIEIMDKGITLDQLRKVYHMACLTHFTTGEKEENGQALDKFSDLINEIHETETEFKQL